MSIEANKVLLISILCFTLRTKPEKRLEQSMLSELGFEEFYGALSVSAFTSHFSPQELNICSDCNSIDIVVTSLRPDAVPGIMIEPL